MNCSTGPRATQPTCQAKTTVRYVTTCPGLDSTGPKGVAAPNALLTELLADKPPPFLEAVPLGQPTPLKVWRVVP